MIFDTHIDEVGTFGAYHNGYYQNKNVLVFPYINTHLTDLHPLNKSGGFVFLDYCYIVLSGYTILKENGIAYENYDDTILFDPNIECLGGDHISLNRDTEYIIRFSHAFLQVPDNYTLSKDYFIPMDTPLIKRNMDEEKVSNFFDKKNIPLNLLKILEH